MVRGHLLLLRAFFHFSRICNVLVFDLCVVYVFKSDLWILQTWYCCDPTAAPTFVNVAGIVLAYAGGVGTEETCTHFPRIRAGVSWFPRNRPKTIDFMSKLTVRTIPRTPRGEGRQEQNKSVLKYSWGRDVHALPQRQVFSILVFGGQTTHGHVMSLKSI